MTTSILDAVIKHFIMGLQLPWTAKENIENNLLVSSKLYNIYRIKTINIYSSSCQTEENRQNHSTSYNYSSLVPCNWVSTGLFSIKCEQHSLQKLHIINNQILSFAILQVEVNQAIFTWSFSRSKLTDWRKIKINTGYFWYK